MLFAIKVSILVLAFMVAYLLRIYWINPKVLEPMCLLNTNRCVKIEYYQRDNSLFAYVTPSAFRIWFNGTTFYVYEVGASTGRLCTDPKYQPAYEVKPKRNAVENYTCIRSIAEVMKYYEGIPKKYVYIRTASPTQFSAFDVIQYFLKHEIIVQPSSSQAGAAR